MDFWVAIIDQGINKSYTKLLNTEVQEVIIKKDGTCSWDCSTIVDNRNVWHGTNIASIIVQAVPTIKILSVRLENDLQITVKQLCSALNYCTSIKKIRVINISLGQLRKKADVDLLESCQKCYESGKILVAAAHLNNSDLCFPAAIPFVYGVGIGLIKERSNFTWLGNDYINVLAKGIYQRLADENGKSMIGEGTSYAAAAFTAIISDILIKNPSFQKNELDLYLKVNSVYSATMHFPVGEVREEVRSEDRVIPQDSLAFPKDDVRIEQLLLQNKQVNYLMGYPVDLGSNCGFKNEINNITIPAIFSKKIFTKFNTLVLGNFLNNVSLVNRLFGWSLVDFFIDNNACVIVLDNYLLETIKSRILETGKSYNGFIKSL